MVSPGAMSPETRIGTSTVTFSPRRTRIRSTCSMKPFTGSRCTAFGRARSAPLFWPSRRSSTFGVFSASIRSCPGRLRWRVSVPCPYSTAGTLPSRRLRRAAPLPNSSRVSAAIFTSGTVLSPHSERAMRVRSVADNAAECGSKQPAVRDAERCPARYRELRVRDSPGLHAPFVVILLVDVVLVVVVIGILVLGLRLARVEPVKLVELVGARQFPGHGGSPHDDPLFPRPQKEMRGRRAASYRPGMIVSGISADVRGSQLGPDFRRLGPVTQALEDGRGLSPRVARLGG